MSAERRVGVRLSRAQDVVGCVAVPGHSPADSWLGCIFIHRRLRRELTILPPTGSSGSTWRWHLCRQVHAGRGFVILTAKRIASHGARRAAGTQARTIQLPQAPWTWIRAGDRHQLWIIGVPCIPADGHVGGTLRQSRPPLRSSKRLPGTSVSLPGITLSDEGGSGERARTRLICTGVGWSPVQVTPAHSWVLCALKNWLRLRLLPLGFRCGRD